MRKLRIAFSKKEKSDRLLAKLNELHEAGEVVEAQYEAMKEEYSTFLEQAEADLSALQSELKERLERSESELSRQKQELENLEVRIKVGELSSEHSRRQENRLRRQTEKLETEVKELTRLLAAASSEDLGGFIDVPLQRGRRPTRKRRH